MDQNLNFETRGLKISRFLTSATYLFTQDIGVNNVIRILVYIDFGNIQYTLMYTRT